ncbi:MAG TPA: hypothetical protein VFF70_05410 [Anaerolineae bacterium]|nr:hypothetical protein [Anaerolineae bacterium]
MQTKSVLLLSVLAVIITACTPTPGGATAMLPNISTANIVEGKTISEFLAGLPGGSTLKTAFPQLFTVVEYVEQVTVCYQKIGAVAVRTYSDKVTPLSSGTVAIIDKKALTDPANLIACLGNTLNPSAQAQPAISPCAKAYTLQKDNNEFFIAYIASTQEMCAAFCSGLEGCAAAP